jgi:sporulation protein YlmC with PRC-barrel domain
MEYKEIQGKEVIGKLAHLIGKVTEIEFDTKTWKVTHICVDVNKNVVEDLGLKKAYDWKCQSYHPSRND